MCVTQGCQLGSLKSNENRKDAALLMKPNYHLNFASTKLQNTKTVNQYLLQTKLPVYTLTAKLNKRKNILHKKTGPLA